MRRCCFELLLALAFVCVASAVCRAQTMVGGAPPPTARYSVSGTVVNAVTGEPVPHALVMIFMTVQHATFTDQGGQFTIGDLPDGSRTTVQVFKPGFFSLAEGGAPQPLVAISGVNTAPMRVTLMPDSVITGHVVDEQGEPVQGAGIVAKCARISDGRKRWDQCGSTGTDEEGAFRMPHVTPGAYYLRVIGGNFRMSGDPSVKPMGYEPAFYPAQRSGVRTTFELLPAARKEINFTLHTTRLYKVYGVVDGISQSQMVNIQLLTADGEQMPAEQQIDPGGTFVLKDVPAGQYRARAMAPNRSYHRSRDGIPRDDLLVAEVPITVASDIAGVTLALRRSAVIPVNVHAELTHDPAENRVGVMTIGKVQIRPGTPAAQVCAHGIDDQQASVCSNLETKDDLPVMELRGVPPGRYNVEVMPMGMLYASSVTRDGVDLLSEPLEVKPGGDATPIEVTLRDDVATLTCSLRTADENTQATVLIVADNGHWMRAQPISGRGEAQIYSIPPGDYKIYAFDSANRLEYRNPEVMSEYATKALPITLQPNENHSLKLDVISGGAK